MRANSEPTPKPQRVPARMAALEQRILKHRISVRCRTASFGRAWRGRMTSGPVLLTACGLGYLLGEITSRQPGGATSRKRKLVSGVLTLLAFARLIPHQVD